jgi:hypothetical protein
VDGARIRRRREEELATRGCIMDEPHPLFSLRASSLRDRACAFTEARCRRPPDNVPPVIATPAHGPRGRSNRKRSVLFVAQANSGRTVAAHALDAVARPNDLATSAGGRSARRASRDPRMLLPRASVVARSRTARGRWARRQSAARCDRPSRRCFRERHKPREAEADGFEWSDFVADFSPLKVRNFGEPRDDGPPAARRTSGRNRAARPRS